MINMNATNFRKNVFDVFKKIIEYNEPINVSTKTGNVVVLSEEEYNSMVETLYLSSNPKLKQDIIDGINTPLEDCIDEKEVKW